MKNVRSGTVAMLGICAVTFSVAAQPLGKQQLAKCAAIEGEGERLVCYDALSNSLGVARPTVVHTSGPSKWSTNVSISPIDDTRTVTAFVDAEQSVKAGYKESRPSLVLRCQSKKTEAYITWELYLGLERTEVLTRVDSAKAVTKSWWISTDNTSTFYSGNNVAFIKSLLGSNKLLAQVTPYSESPVTVVFPTAGLDGAIAQLRKECKW